jgi:hypothetical protein
MTRLQQRRKLLRHLYGFDFPDDFHQFWEFATRLKPLDPLHALYDALGEVLTGPFEVLAGRFDTITPPSCLYLHWRYYMDPPEFFSVLVGNVDGYHTGYYFDDPANPLGCLASYYANDAFELSPDGDTLFEAVRLQLEYHQRDCEESLTHEPEEASHAFGMLTELEGLRHALREYATGRRTETGEAYVEKYLRRRPARWRRVVAATQEGMGIVVPRQQYRPLFRSDEKLWQLLWETDDPAGLAEKARQELRAGYPGTALKVARDLWATGRERHTEYAWELLDAAYTELGRDILREVAQVHRAARDRPWLDILHSDD